MNAADDTCAVVDAAPSGDADVRPDNCFGPLPGLDDVTEVCLDERPTGAIVVSSAIDTDVCEADNLHVVAVDLVSFCVLSAGEINVAARINARGVRPLLLLASESITIFPGAGIDASSVPSSAAPGAGGIASGCIENLDAVQSNGGGAGGSNRGRGGAGGGPGGQPSTVLHPLALAGGCPGGKGGNGMSPGGRGGGAIYISAPIVDVRGILLVSGEGGGVATSDSNGDDLGGGGGGAGGYIGIYGTSVTIDTDARLVAAGGGGGAGRGQAGSVANRGETATDLDPVANGGTVGTSGPNGGPGGDGSDPLDGTLGSSAQSSGGGGGGGGAGYIDLHADAVLECVPPQCVPAAAN